MRLPSPPALEELRAHIPRIEKLPMGARRPFWSVMIPTYNSGEYLRRTLQSVLAQDPGEDVMQIQVVDGGSTDDDSEAITSLLGAGRVEYHRLDRNRGPAFTFNACLERSRGEWVHLLHGDDLVLPQFYEAYAALIRDHAEVKSVFGQVVFIDENDRWEGIYGPPPPPGGGVIPDFSERQATEQLVIAPGIIARREAYESVGGFCSWFGHVVDWDMWARLGQFGPVGCVSRPYAMFRLHSQSHTARSGMMVSASNIRECYYVIRTNLTRLEREGSAAQEHVWRARLAEQAERHMWELDEYSSLGRFNQASWAWMLAPSRQRLMMLAKSWLKYKFVSPRAADSSQPTAS